MLDIKLRDQHHAESNDGVMDFGSYSIYRRIHINDTASPKLLSPHPREKVVS